MPEDIKSLLRRLIGGDAQAPAAILDRATTSRSPPLLVAAALLADTLTAILPVLINRGAPIDRTVTTNSTARSAS